MCIGYAQHGNYHSYNSNLTSKARKLYGNRIQSNDCIALCIHRSALAFIQKVVHFIIDVWKTLNYKIPVYRDRTCFKEQ